MFDISLLEVGIRGMQLIRNITNNLEVRLVFSIQLSLPSSRSPAGVLQLCMRDLDLLLLLINSHLINFVISILDLDLLLVLKEKGAAGVLENFDEGKMYSLLLLGEGEQGESRVCLCSSSCDYCLFARCLFSLFQCTSSVSYSEEAS
jgi:hypothetical protein